MLLLAGIQYNMGGIPTKYTGEVLRINKVRRLGVSNSHVLTPIPLHRRAKMKLYLVYTLLVKLPVFPCMAQTVSVPTRYSTLSSLGEDRACVRRCLLTRSPFLHRRACANHIVENTDKGKPHPKIAEDAGMESIAALDQIRTSSGKLHTSEIRNNMQQTMQTDAAVFRSVTLLHSSAFG